MRLFASCSDEMRASRYVQSVCGGLPMEFALQFVILYILAITSRVEWLWWLLACIFFVVLTRGTSFFFLRACTDGLCVPHMIRSNNLFNSLHN